MALLDCARTFLACCRRERHAQAIRALGGHVGYSDLTFDCTGFVKKRRLERLVAKLLGRGFVDSVCAVTVSSDREITHVERLPDLADIESAVIMDGPVSDRGFSVLSRMPSLESVRVNSPAYSDSHVLFLAQAPSLVSVDLSGTAVTDLAIETLGTLSRIRFLELNGTCIEGTALDGLAALPELRVLGLARTRVSDECLVRLLRLTQLEELDLQGTHMTSRAVETLRQELHDANILHSTAE